MSELEEGRESRAIGEGSIGGSSACRSAFLSVCALWPNVANHLGLISTLAFAVYLAQSKVARVMRFSPFVLQRLVARPRHARR